MRLSRRILVIVVGAAIAACTVERNSSVDDIRDLVIERDAGPRVDAAPDAGPVDGCVPGDEACNGEDDDCDGLIDEGFDVTSDPDNCGECGQTCSASQACMAGSCRVVVVELTCGAVHSCALRSDGAAFCWGSNVSGQVGDGTYVTRSLPTPVQGLNDAREISAGGSFTCALRAGGGVVCWGRNSESQLGSDSGDGMISRPVQVAGLPRATSLGVGARHGCATIENGTVYCWGWNQFEQLGRAGGSELPPGAVPNLVSVVEVDGGYGFTCARHTNGTVSCWGRNDTGQLGDGTLASRGTPARVTSLSNVADIATGGGHACALLATGEVRCWGSNLGGEVGDGSGVVQTSPVSSGVSDATTLGVRNAGTCAGSSDGVVRCWGPNDQGQVGDGTMKDQLVPATVLGLEDIFALNDDYGDVHTCAVLADRRVVCWGANGSGQLGVGTNEAHTTPGPTVPGF